MQDEIIALAAFSDNLELWVFAIVDWLTLGLGICKRCSNSTIPLHPTSNYLVYAFRTRHVVGWLGQTQV